MRIILVRIPSDTTHNDISDFLSGTLKGGLFDRTGIIEKIEILNLYDEKTNTIEYHGVIRIEPDIAAQRVIKKLNRKAINGKHIVVREYQLRNWHRDQRLRPPPPRSIFSNRRNADRRRSHLLVLAADHESASNSL